MDRVLVVDDEDLVRRTLTRMLNRHGYSCDSAGSAAEARKKLEQEPFRVMLTDVSMPGESGLDLVRGVLQENQGVAVIMITGIDDPEVAKVAIEHGAYGFIIKPFEPNEVLINIANALRRRALEVENRAHRDRLEQMVAERTGELEKAIKRINLIEVEIRTSQAETIHRLSKAAEFRDNETAQHIERMSRFCGLIAKKLGLESEHAELIRVASPLHDVGKIGTPDQILLKPGRLTTEEFDVMREHAEIGYRILSGSGSQMLNMAATIARTHHEKVDGSGYPKKLKGEEIPIEGRIAAVADVFDALTMRRVYKEAFPVEKAVSILEEGRGTHFDPVSLDAFLNAMDEVEAIRRDFADQMPSVDVV